MKRLYIQHAFKKLCRMMVLYKSSGLEFIGKSQCYYLQAMQFWESICLILFVYNWDNDNVPNPRTNLTKTNIR